jgi:tRNA threonylcarbamoyladenosine biosynthesis protein TsaB
MAHILSLETSTDVCSVALHHDRNLIKEAAIVRPQAHASELAPMIQRLCTEAEIKVNALDAVAISAGPGSYTGLRIGTSTAKGICYSLDIPLITLPTLDLLAFQATPNNPEFFLLCPMIDARRMEVYCKILDADLQTLSPVEARVIDHESFRELLQTRKMLFFGNGAEKCKSVLKHENAFFVDGISPLASALGVLAFEKYRTKNFEDLENFKPLYLKEFIAKKAQPLLD